MWMIVDGSSNAFVTSRRPKLNVELRATGPDGPDGFRLGEGSGIASLVVAVARREKLRLVCAIS
jgi:hypothetical protein